ncbi:MAG: transporter substrate-binding domain-containing protein [Rhodospirillales bacterium]|jgi:ABC-type amino acid transport substrate-binding protein|nr:transporter substrate-binding domain-containing protein [Rhodospirillales bacterium]
MRCAFELRKGRRVSSRGLLSALALVFLQSSVSATDLADPKTSENTVSFATMDVPPYGFKNAKNQQEGYLYDLGERVLNEAGFNTHQAVLPLKRLIEEMKIGRRDCTFMARTPLVQRIFRLIEPIGKELEAVVVARAGIPINRYDDLIGLRIAVPLGISFDPRFDNDKSLTKVPTKDYQQSVKMLIGGRVDAVAGALDSLTFNLRQMGLDPKEELDEPLVFNRVSLWLVCRADGPKKAKEIRLQDAVRELRENGSITKIIENYL